MTTIVDSNSNAATSAQSDGKDMPPWSSLLMLCYLVFLTVVNMVIVIPTADDYASRLGAGEAFSGLLIALTPFFQGIIGLPLNFLMLKARMTLKSVLVLMAAGSVIGNVLYALAGLMHSPLALLASRALIGVCQCQIAGPLYISKTVCIRRRTHIMFIFASFPALAFTCGPLLAGLLDTFIKQIRHEDLVLDSDTIPGWFMACLYFLYIIKLYFFFDPEFVDSCNSTPGIQNRQEDEEQSSRISIFSCGLLVCYCSMFAGPFANTMCEVFAVRLVQQWYGWSISVSAFYMSAVMAVVTVISLCSSFITNLMEDRTGLLLWTLLGAISAILLFDFGYSSRVTYAYMFTTGLVLYQGAACIVRNYIYAMVSKLVPPEKKSSASVCSQFVLMMGRGSGSLLGALLTPVTFAAVQVALFALISALVATTFSHLKQHDKAT